MLIEKITHTLARTRTLPEENKHKNKRERARKSVLKGELASNTKPNQRRQTHASYGIEGMRDRFCAKHKTVHMLNLTVRKCEFDGCLAQPTCNRPELKKPR